MSCLPTAGSTAPMTCRLRSDYRLPDIGFGTWEGVLYHEPPSLEQIRQVREKALNWARPSQDRLEHDFYLQDAEGESKLDLDEAYRCWSDPNHSAFQINLYLDHPLTLPEQSPHRDAKLWLYQDMTEILLFQGCAVSGDCRVDLDNFFLFHKLLVDLADILQPSFFAWGEHADSWKPEKRLPIAALRDERHLWQLFTSNLAEVVSTENLPASLRGEFQQRYLEI